MRAVLALAVLLVATAVFATQMDDTSPGVQEIDAGKEVEPATEELQDENDFDDAERTLKEAADLTSPRDKLTVECKESYHEIAKANCRSKNITHSDCVPEAPSSTADWYCDPSGGSASTLTCSDAPKYKCREVITKGTDNFPAARCCTWDPTKAWACDYDVNALGSPVGRQCPEPTKEEMEEWEKRKR
jgi:hypothetical protein